MPWDLIKLNDGTSIPSVAYGTWTLGNGDQTVNYVDEAISVGFAHIDTAQGYRNEEEAGKAIRESGLARKDIYITTKFSARDGLSIEESIQGSLKDLGVEYVDLYLIHNPRIAQPDIPTAWAAMEKLKAQGLAKSIGVSNFEIPHLEVLLNSAKVLPAANQIQIHAYNFHQQLPLIEFGNKHGIVAEGYSPLIPVTRMPGGPVDKPLNKISSRLNAKPEQVLLAWAKSKGIVVVTSSTKKERMEGYIAAGDLPLTDEDIAAIDAAGKQGARQQTARAFLRRAVLACAVASVALGLAGALGIDIL
ncbi:Aldo/keto reductase [Lentinus tigrinus ALCF2SS1-7]|uniref:Aldo/keto reductase n=1 Tax=Lentinus tigrinus ALCF2SS1-6 TaxID=1328759 RepID=A0A5C2SPX1_9APHY|nr:Aldo/keto reductase [Lentinus tigrinus ALCF2SS1-6]RPD79208.1 Aldo/keto reductase [Lentinus tigrinus ALCF2SS1-7]